jgi:hypothetical protein
VDEFVFHFVLGLLGFDSRTERDAKRDPSLRSG